MKTLQLKAIFIILFYCLLSNFLQGQTPNNCNVVASMLPARDTVFSTGGNILLSSTSTNATTYQFFIDGFFNGANQSLNISIPVGLTEIKIVAINGTCTDTATVFLFYAGTAPTDLNNAKLYVGIPKVAQYVSNFISSQSGGYIIAGDRNNNGYLNLVQRGYILKLKENGCIAWAKMLNANFAQGISIIENITEAPDGTIYASGVTNGNLPIVFKLNSNGDIIWIKEITLPGTYSFSINNILALPDNGAVIACGTFTTPYNFIVMRINASGGIMWQKEYKKDFFSSKGLVQIAQKNGSVYIGGVPSFNTPTLGGAGILMKINLTAGQTQWTRKYSTANGYAIIKDIHFSDTGLIVNTITGSEVLNINTITTIMNLDSLGSVINATAISQANNNGNYGAGSSSIIPISNKQYYVFSRGSIPLSLQPYISYQNRIAKLDSNFDVKWSKSYGGAGRGLFFHAALGNKETLVLAGTENGQGAIGYYGPRVALQKVDSSGITPLTSCSFSTWQLFKIPVAVTSSPIVWDSDTTINLVNINNLNNLFNSIYPQVKYQCPEYVDSCSFFILTGKKRICNTSNIYEYKVHKNKACNQQTIWSVSTNVIVISQTDTLLKVRFPDFGTYTIKASLLLSCVPSSDSIIVTAASTSPVLNLGNDVSICSNSTIVLHAGPKYLNYIWQDGSTDSVLSLNAPGVYHVRVTDSCGNIMRDTVNVSLNPSVNLHISNDRVKCNNDTIHLSAPVGYTNYQWLPPYNFITNTGQNVIVNPLVDTSYYFKAEISPGCFVFDTVKIKVKNSNSINLGIDTSFCMGDSLSLNAGNGFTQYVWNAGQISSQIWARTTGFYSVIATAINGCTSKDTLQVVNIFSNPVAKLDRSSNLCRGENRKLDAGTGFSSYMWNTNATTQIIYPSTVGFYKVVITDMNGCKGSDSVSIMTISDSPSDFLRDTLSKCDYESISINSSNNYTSYLWSTGSQNKQIIIEKSGKYFLTVIDDKNCKGIDSINIFHKDCLKGFYIPSAFTPDNNGKNDVFKPFISGLISNYTFKIYNRYGQLVFVSTDRNIGWNGKTTGTILNNNTFVWICSYTSNSGVHLEERGTVLLIR